MELKDKRKAKVELLKSIKREKTRNYIILYLVTFVILIVLILFSFSQNYFSSQDFIVNIVNNIIGIIPPILIFDFFQEKLTRDSSTVEVSNMITETLMSNPETLELFTEEQRKNFIESTVMSIVKDADMAEMINSNLSYLTIKSGFRIKTSFHYNFELSQEFPRVYDKLLSDIKNYFYVQEKLNYTVKYLDSDANDIKSEEINIGFLFDNKELDSALRDLQNDLDFKRCIFRESLSMNNSDIEKLKLLFNRDDKLSRISQCQELFKISIQIDEFKGEVSDVLLKQNGFIVKVIADHDTCAQEHTVRIVFRMPRRWDSPLEVVIVDPTKALNVSLSYPEETMQVEMYPFLNEGKESSLEVAHEHMNGIYDIMISNKWVHPISGMVFIATDNNGNSLLID